MPDQGFDYCVSTKYKKIVAKYIYAYVNEMDKGFSITDTGQSRPMMMKDLGPFIYNNWPLAFFCCYTLVGTVS